MPIFTHGPWLFWVWSPVARAWRQVKACPDKGEAVDCARDHIALGGRAKVTFHGEQVFPTAGLRGSKHLRDAPRGGKARGAAGWRLDPAHPAPNELFRRGRWTVYHSNVHFGDAGSPRYWLAEGPGVSADADDAPMHATRAAAQAFADARIAEQRAWFPGSFCEACLTSHTSQWGSACPYGGKPRGGKARKAAGACPGLDRWRRQTARADEGRRTHGYSHDAGARRFWIVSVDDELGGQHGWLARTAPARRGALAAGRWESVEPDGSTAPTAGGHRYGSARAAHAAVLRFCAGAPARTPARARSGGGAKLGQLAGAVNKLTR